MNKLAGFTVWTFNLLTLQVALHAELKCRVGGSWLEARGGFPE